MSSNQERISESDIDASGEGLGYALSKNISVNRRLFLQAGAVALAQIFIPAIRPEKSQASTLPAPDFYPSGSLNLRINRDGEVPASQFFAESEGSNLGYIVADTDQAPMLTVYRLQGGVDVLGPPISQTWVDDVGRTCQAFPKGILQIRNTSGGTTVERMNIYDILAQRGINLDNPTDITPNPFDFSDDQGLPWGHTETGAIDGTVEANHLRKVFGAIPEFSRQLAEAYFANPHWFDDYGLPMSAKDYGPVVVVRCQRTTLQLWKDKTAWTSKPLEVVLANGGSVAKEKGVIPSSAVSPVENPGAVSSPQTEGLPTELQDFLNNKTETVNRIIVDAGGKSLTIENRHVKGSKYQIVLNPDTKEQFTDLLTEIAQINGYDSITLVACNVLNSGFEPFAKKYPEDNDLPPYPGNQWNQGAYMVDLPGYGKTRLMRGKYGGEVVNHQAFFYFRAPQELLNVQEQSYLDAVESYLEEALTIIIESGNWDWFHNRATPPQKDWANKAIILFKSAVSLKPAL